MESKPWGHDQTQVGYKCRKICECDTGGQCSIRQCLLDTHAAQLPGLLAKTGSGWVSGMNQVWEGE